MSSVRGFAEARAQAKVMPAILDREVMTELEETGTRVHERGRRNIDAMVKKHSGRLRRFYRRVSRPAKMMVLVGYTSKTARLEAFYARFVHDGTQRSDPHPFHDLAVADEQSGHNRRMSGALDRSIRLASPSGLAKTGRGPVTGL